MKCWKRITRLQWYSFVASMPIIDILLNYILFDDRLFRDAKVWLVSFPLIFILGAGSWRLLVLMGNRVRHKYAELNQTKKRLLVQALCLLPLMSCCVALIFFIYGGLHILGYQLVYEDLKMGLLVGFCVNVIFETLFEADFTLERYKLSVEEKHHLQQLSLMQEFDSLKNQVNPHFLFNCFNTLSSLIVENKQRAEQFLDELSKVYRYLLRSNEDGLSTIESEVNFIKSYYKLLQTRHGEAVVVNIDTDKHYSAYLLPSLSLQLLVENVVKHNTLSKSRPLVIDIFTTAGNKLIVNNNLQRRAIKAPSNRVGLNNIKAKYHLLNVKGFQVMEDEKNFTVVLPLIWNNASESKRTASIQTESV